MRESRLVVTPHRAALVVTLLFVALGALYASTTPLFEGGDELWHYPLVRHLSQGGAFPVQDPNDVGPWKQQASQPPLYYLLMGAATSWIDTSDFAGVYFLNPHVDNGIVTADGNINLAVHTAAEAWPWRGTTLAVRLVRLLSVLMGAGTVYLTFHLARTVFPGWPWLAVGTMALVAFNPMFLFISGAVNNDNLAVLLATTATLLTAQLARRVHPDYTDGDLLDRALRVDWRFGDAVVPFHLSLRHVLLGVVLGLAGQTKLSAATVGPMAVLVMTWAEGVRWYARTDRATLAVIAGHALVLAVRGLLTFLPTALIAGPWFLRNLRLYGSLTGLNAFIDILGQRAQPAPLAQLWSERDGFMQSYWGLFGGVNVPFPGWAYAVLNALAVLGALGLVLLLWRSWRDYRWDTRRWAPLLTTLGVVAIVVMFLIQWATTTWSSQGRLVFAAIAALNTVFLGGLVAWLPPRMVAGRRAIAGVVAGFMLALAVWAPLGIIAPAYADPPAADLTTMETALNIDFGAGNEPDEMRLLGYTLHNDALQPGGTVSVTLYWEALTAMNRNWSVFVHLRDADGIVIAQRDTYPGMGLMMTRKLVPGQTLADTYVIGLPQASPAPNVATIEVGLYDLSDGFRLPPRDGERNLVELGTVRIEPNAGELPNPQALNFEHRLEVAGYTIDRRVVPAGESFTMTLYWRALRRMDIDYTAFIHVRGPGESLWGQLDSWPGDRATSGLVPGELIEDVRTITVNPDTAPGQYDLELGVYEYRDGEFLRLQLIDEHGRWLDNFTFLGQIRVTE